MSNAEEKDLTKRRKRLLFRANHRGIKEADIMIGSFVEKNVGNFSHEDCAWFETLFEETDYDIINWMTKKAPPPQKFDTKLMAEMQKLNYIPQKNKE